MKKEAFTLTELLVVVVIIGVLSAVVLPKFSKVIESRRTAEAESVMVAVRNEQEMRCTLDKNYTTNKDNLAVWPKRDSDNYTYALNANGITATRKDESKPYTLEIKTYLDGGICCSGAYCANLNKDYPRCDEYDATPNTTDCVPEGVVPPTPPVPPACEIPTQTTETQPCGCTNQGTKTRTFDEGTCEWGEWSACSETEDCPPSCVKPSKPNPGVKTCPCGEQVTGVPTWNEENCRWDMVFPECPTTTCCDTSHSEGETETYECSQDTCGVGTKTWTCNNGEWESRDDGGCKPMPSTVKGCPQRSYENGRVWIGTGTVTITWGCVRNEWVITNEDHSDCEDEQVDCVQLVSGSTKIDSENYYYYGLTPCSRYGVSAGSYVALGAVSQGPFCRVSREEPGGLGYYPSVTYLLPGPTMRCYKWQITELKRNSIL